jgi:hypothetical protein
MIFSLQSSRLDIRWILSSFSAFSRSGDPWVELEHAELGRDLRGCSKWDPNHVKHDTHEVFLSRGTRSYGWRSRLLEVGLLTGLLVSTAVWIYFLGWSLWKASAWLMG